MLFFRGSNIFFGTKSLENHWNSKNSPFLSIIFFRKKVTEKITDISKAHFSSVIFKSFERNFFYIFRHPTPSKEWLRQNMAKVELWLFSLKSTIFLINFYISVNNDIRRRRTRKLPFFIKFSCHFWWHFIRFSTITNHHFNIHINKYQC